MRSILLAFALGAGALTATASPVETDTADKPASWQMRPFTIYDTDDRNKPAEEREVRYAGVIVHTASAEKPGALFSCSKKFGLSVMFGLKPVDFADEAYFASSKQVRGFPGRLIVDGVRPNAANRFIVKRKLGVAQPTNTELAFDTVTALYAGKPVSVDVVGFDPVDINLPAPDESFKAFVAACPAFEQSVG
jgi:hypothetical protein